MSGLQDVQPGRPGLPARRAAPVRIARFTGRAGRAWKRRIEWLMESGAESGATRAGRELAERHAIELVLERLRAGGQPASAGERQIAALAEDVVRLAQSLPPSGRERLDAMLAAALAPGGTLVALFHLLRTAARQRARGFEVFFDGLGAGAGYDLLLRRDGSFAEIACDVLSAEEGRDLHRGAWATLMDRIDPELQTWLNAHPGRYLLKMTLPNGLKAGISAERPDGDLAALHARISALLRERRRADQDEAAVLRLDPLLLAGAQAAELGFASRLRQEFGPEAHLSVTASGRGVFVMAARAGREDEIPCAVRRRLCAVAPSRLTGERPGVVALFLEDTDRHEWRRLRDDLSLEGEVRQFLTRPEARPVVAVTCATRLELFGAPFPAGARDGELRFRNPRHPAAKDPALASAISSSA